MSAFYSPLRYPGGKNCIFPFMASLIQENGLEGCSYAEPFAGGAGLALHLLMKGIVSEIHLNDFDHSIYAIWHTILYNTDAFCEWVRHVNVNMGTWEWAKNVHSNMADFDLFEIAKATFFLNRTNVSGIIMGGPIGGPNQTGKFKIDARFNKTDLIKRIYAIAGYRRNIHIYEMDGEQFLKKMNRKQAQMFIYIDPPYVNKGADLYMNFFKKEDHVRLCSQVKKLRKHWLVSYDSSDLIFDLYRKYNPIRYTLSQCTSNRMGDEVIIFPPSINILQSISRLKAPASIIPNNNMLSGK